MVSVPLRGIVGIDPNSALKAELERSKILVSVPLRGIVGIDPGYSVVFGLVDNQGFRPLAGNCRYRSWLG